ncbi:HPP family protein [Rhodococcus maanshanensis]|uniref:HPP family protein n=1 Tax=Rhodococcus maanshanensis TaxID=183556 RepID=A0A1H7WM62_9NOCA|nr:HPP family protein [Rhodococcus maanshanensis]SEM22205.1 HPP family protein [Rhodococcus maanshanensis]
MSVLTSASATIARRGTTVSALSAAAAALIIIASLATAGHLLGLAVFALPFVASAALIALAPSGPPARPGAILRAYPAAAATALPITAVLGPSETAVAVSVVATVALMAILRAPHIPAALCAGGIGLTDPGLGYLPHTLIPAVAIVLVAAAAAGRIVPGFEYPLRG